MAANDAPPTTPEDSSFACWRLNKTTFVVREDDVFGERPLVYVKIHSKAQAVIVTDTGCDAPRMKHHDARYDRLRDFIENYPIPSNQAQPLNPQGKRRYIVICTHCHYDHIGGIEQFLRTGDDLPAAEIIASAAGRDFIESDLDRHSLCSLLGRSAPAYTVTHWATAFERYGSGAMAKKATTAIFAGFRRETDYAITFIHTPGHTPDSLAWYDEAEMQLFVGDSLYEEGAEGMAIIFVRESDLVEWFYSMLKLLQFVRSRMYRLIAKAGCATAQSSKNDNDDDDDGNDADEREWVKMTRRVKLAAGHQTYAADAEEILEHVLAFWRRVVNDDVPVAKREFRQGEKFFTWRDEGGDVSKMSLSAPIRLMREAQALLGDHLRDGG